jgi:hypothetical protein
MALELKEGSKSARFSQPGSRKGVALSLIRALLFVLAWLLLGPTGLYTQATGGLDPSWNIGIQRRGCSAADGRKRPPCQRDGIRDIQRPEP